MPDLDRDTAHLDPLSLSVELSREHRGLKVALPLMLHGEQAFADALDEKMDLTVYLYDQLLQIPEVEVLNEPELSTVAFRLHTDSLKGDAINRDLLERIIAGGKVYISGTVLKGSFALRISCLSHRTHMAQARQMINELKRGIAELRVVGALR